MAVHWEEAGVVVTCAGMGELEGVPDDAILVALQPEGTDSPEVVEAVRNLVLDRLIERRRQVIEEVYERGTSLLEPESIELGGESSEGTAEAERTLLEALREREGHVADDEAAPDDWADPAADLGAGGLWLGGSPSAGTRVFVNRVSRLVVKG